NLLAGTVAGAMVTVEGSGFELTTTSDLVGPVHAVIDPRAVALYRDPPDGSPRNTWPATVEWVEPIGRITRVRLDGPLPLHADITPSAAEGLGLGPGTPVWAAVKATEISVQAR
ncbi:MAG: TOBE-like domain-containing protein, partial [Actinomycetota bacterium]